MFLRVVDTRNGVETRWEQWGMDGIRTIYHCHTVSDIGYVTGLQDMASQKNARGGGHPALFATNVGTGTL